MVGRAASILTGGALSVAAPLLKAEVEEYYKGAADRVTKQKRYEEHLQR